MYNKVILPITKHLTMSSISIISPNQIKLNNISYYKISNTSLYSLYYTLNNTNYSNLTHRLFKLPNPTK